jgi:hypothetical protein
MASITVNQGLQMIGDRASGVAGAGAAAVSMAVDDSATAFAAGTTTLASPTNLQANAFDSTPTRSGQTVTHLMTLTTGQFNTFTVKRVSLHNVAAGSVTGTSTSLIAGIDGLSLTKQSTFSLKLTVQITYTSV